MKKIKRLKYIWAVYIALAFLMIIPYVVLNNIKPKKEPPKPVHKIQVYTIQKELFVKAKAFLIKDVNSSKIIYAKDARLKMPPASLTKVMTAVIAIENGKLNDLVTIQQDATRVEQFRFGAQAGDKFTMKQLLIAALVSSSNDAATAIGIHLAGSVDKFADLMNKKAKVLGMNDTHFTNPCGFDIGENLTTAYDLALLSEYVITLPHFNEMVNYREVVISNASNSRHYKLKTHNKLFEKYPYTVGIKTGYTAKAGPCLIARAKKNNRDLLLIILNSDKKIRWQTAQENFESVFNTAVK